MSARSGVDGLGATRGSRGDTILHGTRRCISISSRTHAQDARCNSHAWTRCTDTVRFEKNCGLFASCELTASSALRGRDPVSTVTRGLCRGR